MMEPQNSLPRIDVNFIDKFINNIKTDKFIVNNFKWQRLYEPNARNNIHFDLNYGFNFFQSAQIYDESIDPILKFIMETSNKGSTLRDVIHGCDFVTNRATFAAIGINHNRFSWCEPCQFVFSKFMNVIFVYKHSTKKRPGKQETGDEVKLNYWGHKFKQYLTTDSSNPSINESVLAPQYAVFKSQLTSCGSQKMNLLLNAAMDCVDNNGKFIEIKTMLKKPLKQAWRNAEPNWFYAFKSKWWRQCYLIGVEGIIVGMRDENGTVSEVHKMNTRTASQVKKNWEPNDCLNALFDFLSVVREMLHSKPEGALLKADFLPSIIEPKIEWISEEERQKYECLPPEFIQHFFAK